MSQETPQNIPLSCLRSSFYNLGMTTKGNTAFQQFFCCYRGVFTSPLHRNDSSSIIAYVFISAGTCLPSRCLAMTVQAGSTIQRFGRHVTVIIRYSCWLKVICHSSVRIATGYRMDERPGFESQHVQWYFSSPQISHLLCGPLSLL
jgi:hypothetical protein